MQHLGPYACCHLAEGVHEGQQVPLKRQRSLIGHFGWCSVDGDGKNLNGIYAAAYCWAL
jgi:hypothetical protein